jgi:hypothetical protein
MKLKRILTAAIVVVMTLGMFSLNTANAAGTYSISCKNDAYGMQLGSDYTQVAYAYAGLTAGQATNIHNDYLIQGTVGAYVGNDCIYSGAGDTNGTAVVAGDVARLAINAIVGAVSNRIDMAYAANNSGASATGLSFTTQGDGASMAANGLVGGLGFWADYSNSDIENTQDFTNVRLDSMRYSGDGSSYSIGVDKTFGKSLIGLVVSNLDTDFKTTFNDGTYKQEVDTYGVYFAYKTSMLQIDLGMGQGDSSINTTRRDLGNDKVISGSTTADVEYSNARIAANFSRGKFNIVPSVSYRTFSMDIAAFTDVRPSDDTGVVEGGEQTIFSTNNATLTSTDDSIAARSVESETMSIGVDISANLGKLVPYISLSYDSEDTTKAAYKAEVGTDGNDTETAGTNYSSSMKIGGGINFMLNSNISGGVRAGWISGRDDWEENYMGANLNVGF